MGGWTILFCLHSHFTIRKKMHSSCFTINGSDIRLLIVLCHRQRVGLYKRCIEGCSESIEIANHMFMILSEQRRNNIPFSREVKQSEKIVFRYIISAPASYIDVGKAAVGTTFQFKIFKCQ